MTMRAILDAARFADLTVDLRSGCSRWVALPAILHALVLDDSAVRAAVTTALRRWLRAWTFALFTAAATALDPDHHSRARGRRGRWPSEPAADGAGDAAVGEDLEQLAVGEDEAGQRPALAGAGVDAPQRAALPGRGAGGIGRR